MHRRLPAIGALAALATALVIAALVPAAAGASSRTILRAQTLHGVPAAYTGTQNSIRGLAGGGLPWVVSFGRVELSEGGWLEVKVKGLVIDPNDPTAIARGLAGTNPSASFRAIVSCQTAGGGVQNIMSDPFPATTGLGGGDAETGQMLAIPDPCLAPIVFVASPAGAWFAVTGG